MPLRGEGFTTRDPLSEKEQDSVLTFAFHPFGKAAHRPVSVAGNVKANGTILRMNKDGSDLEVYAWGLRNPFGVNWAEGKLYASENGFDVRGSRPIANDKEDLYEIIQGAWYGWPDFASGVPVTDPQFKPKHGPSPQFLMAKHPSVEKPIMTFPKHSSATKLASSPNEKFGKGAIFLAFFGHMSPMTGEAGEEHGGHRVVRIDLASKTAETFFSQKSHGGGHHKSSSTGSSSQSSVGDEQNQGSSSSESHGSEEESVTSGPRRLMDVVFSPQGDALYIVDFGSMVIKDEPRPIRNTGVIWRVKQSGEKLRGHPPARLSAPDSPPRQDLAAR
jgi:glucose/arabinose dehydrogenase